METNFFGVLALTRALLPTFRSQKRGRIVLVSSQAALAGQPGNSIYAASKWALEGWAESLAYEVDPFGIDVVVIEPGPIKTEFGNTAIANVGRVSNDGSPYAAFNAAVAGKIHEAFEGWMAVAAGAPEDVAKAIEHAISASRPRTRYPITAAARVMMFLRRWLPDRGFDAFLRTQFPPPQPS